MKVYLASKSKIKVNACHQAFTSCFKKEIYVYPVTVSSLVSEQPLGKFEIIEGAKNRLNGLLDYYNDSYFVSIENGIFYEDGRFFDIAYVLVKSLNGEEFYIWSEAIEFPFEYAKRAYILGGIKTAGEMMIEEGIIKNHNDPHKELIGISREVILKNALIKILKTIKKT
ncbi:MAG: inosine/xanthosine triphosphatase [Candidatus Pacebacteria bacterium]|nr:inosine/xanthosine triphosphatase [Candidatus Paceibacterota bacterium]